MRNIKAVFIKQLLSFFKNPGMWGAPATFLLIPFAFRIFLGAEDMPIIVTQFVAMFVGISMIGVSGAFIIEDRSTMNLRFMGMAGVKPYQYLIATCTALLIVSIIANFIFGMIGGRWGIEMLNFMILSTIAAFTSMLLGITLRLIKGVGEFTPIIGILLGVGPSFAEVNETLTMIFNVTFTFQIQQGLRADLTTLDSDVLQIVLINMAVILAAFIVMNLRTGLDGEKMAKTA